MKTDKKLVNVSKMNQYVAGVISGDILACKWIRLACERHVKDLEKAKTKDWPYRFDETKAERICKYLNLLPHVKGKWSLATKP